MVATLIETNLIVTGSVDKTLFFFKFVTTDKGIDMDPIRCVKLEDIAINFEWISSQVAFGIQISTVTSASIFVLGQRSAVDFRDG